MKRPRGKLFLLVLVLALSPSFFEHEVNDENDR
jgi:hypothetical protein